MEGFNGAWIHRIREKYKLGYFKDTSYSFICVVLLAMSQYCILVGMSQTSHTWAQPPGTMWGIAVRDKRE